MKHAVKLLSNRQREVFELSRHHMLTNKEIAEQLNICYIYSTGPPFCLLKNYTHLL
ncbi:MAG: sigma factor-like helix-turn-helix DNA-binding protein [Phocaeicola vulgatus]